MINFDGPNFVDIKLGDKGPRVKELQQFLNKVGAKLTTDGSFGNLTAVAVKNFQTKCKLKATGVVDGVTFTKLKNAVGIVNAAIAKPKSLWISMRKFDSNIKYVVLPQNKFFVHYEKGIVGKMEKVTDVTNKLLKEGNKVAVAINGGFFGGNQDQLGLSLDEGSYQNKASAEFVDLLYRKDGKFIVDNWNENTPNIWANRNVYHWGMGTSFSLVQDGVINTENMSRFAHAYSNEPRTLIGQKLNGDIIFVVVDGRSDISAGITGAEAAELMLALGCHQAVNLDGGGSTVGTETVNGVSVVINKPSDLTGERRVGSMLIAYYIL